MGSWLKDPDPEDASGLWRSAGLPPQGERGQHRRLTRNRCVDRRDLGASEPPRPGRHAQGDTAWAVGLLQPRSGHGRASNARGPAAPRAGRVSRGAPRRRHNVRRLGRAARDGHATLVTIADAKVSFLQQISTEFADPQAEVAVVAIRSEDVTALDRALTVRPDLARLRVRGYRGRTLLHIATDWPAHLLNCPAVVSLLIDHGAASSRRGPQLDTRRRRRDGSWQFHRTVTRCR